MKKHQVGNCLYDAKSRGTGCRADVRPLPELQAVSYRNPEHLGNNRRGYLGGVVTD